MSFTLYRMYDVAGNVLYIGRTIQPLSRLQNHKSEKDWWEHVRHISLEHFGSAEELRRAELEAIENEHPIHNVIGKSLRNKIAAMGREIDRIHDVPEGTSLESLYFWHWPPEECSPRNFEEVYEQVKKDLMILRRARDRVGRTPTAEEVSEEWREEWRRAEIES